jgi:iron complex outermembrane receptor protein
VKDFQSNAFTGVGFALTNAGQETTKGVEFDSSYAPIKNLVLGLNAAYIEAKYDSFSRASCQTLILTNPCGQGVLFHDLSGQSKLDNPKWAVTASAIYTADLGKGYGGFIRGEYDYSNSFLSSENVPAVYSTTNINAINGSIGITTPYKLDVTFWVRNLTKDTGFRAGFATSLQPGSYSGYPVEPRRYGITIRKTF